ncbi:lytic murein transglycosylase B [Comamonas composti]|uniref:lytic murein transglycosylase B n=1 Tax=Comamonas composti TaxID=408558 RepID=UPI0004025006|nr:lytic murein transglycosylase B [Comamonas composti]
MNPATSICSALLCLALWPMAAQASPTPPKKPVKAKVATQPSSRSYAGEAKALELGADIARSSQLPLEWVQATLAQARFVPIIPRLMTPAGSGTIKHWGVYRSRFIDPVRIRAGVRFWQAHADTLARAEQVYGVPAEIIVGIIGVETIYGQQMGSFRVLDALTTLSLDFPQAHPRAQARTAFFRGELEQFLRFTHDSGKSPMSYLGSYAGAMGLGQFMPSSWARWAVDFDGDGQIDLFNSPVDAIGSVANYFVAHGWRSGMPTVFDVDMQARGSDLAELLAPDIQPSFTVEQMREKGVRVLDAHDYDRPLALIRLDNGLNGQPQYVAGTENFYVVTRYNWSAFYALSVIELGREVAQAYRAGS